MEIKIDLEYVCGHLRSEHWEVNLNDENNLITEIKEENE